MLSLMLFGLLSVGLNQDDAFYRASSQGPLPYSMSHCAQKEHFSSGKITTSGTTHHFASSWFCEPLAV
ncbi:MAG: hypothetical protein AAF039_09720 [Bacteroidota bacterium]